jgi:UDP-glucose 4-epimerase
MNVLVTGGAGYIGSHIVQALHARGEKVIVLDDLSIGHREALPDNVSLRVADIRDSVTVRAILEKEEIESVVHFAGRSYVGESVIDPLGYYSTNVAGSVSLLQAMQEAGVHRLIFSSTCAIYGVAAELPITEKTPERPVSPYGRSKWMVEQILADYANSIPEFSYAVLRYFNVAGCALDGSIGEDHQPETHLIPLLLLTALKLRDAVTIYGDDHDTPDGTCIRDYIHVEDVVAAYVGVMNTLRPGQRLIYNLGTGRGMSVREIINAARRVTGTEIKVEVGSRRPGDPAVLYADPSRIEKELGWRAQVQDVHEIIASAWTWFRSNPRGYRDRGSQASMMQRPSTRSMMVMDANQ